MKEDKNLSKDDKIEETIIEIENIFETYRKKFSEFLKGGK